MYLKDEAGNKSGIIYNGSYYHYVFNAQGDVMAILNNSGGIVAKYTYDAWGKVKVLNSSGVENTNPLFIGNANPIWYRGYYFDTETGLYYLQSRYYDPETGWFVNADKQLNTSQGVFGTNMYVYCLNNPVSMADYSGNKPGDLFNSMDAAARDAAEYLGALSWENGWEYGTSIYTTTVTETRTGWKTNINQFLNFSWRRGFYMDYWITYSQYTYTTEVTKYTYKSVKTLKKNNVTSVGSAPLLKKRVVALHTHPMGSWAGITRFSSGDFDWVAHYKIPLYVHGPNGELKRLDPGAGEDILVFSDLPISQNTPWLD